MCSVLSIQLNSYYLHLSCLESCCFLLATFREILLPSSGKCEWRSAWYLCACRRHRYVRLLLLIGRFALRMYMDSVLMAMCFWGWNFGSCFSFLGSFVVLVSRWQVIWMIYHWCGVYFLQSKLLLLLFWFSNAFRNPILSCYSNESHGCISNSVLKSGVFRKLIWRLRCVHWLWCWGFFLFLQHKQLHNPYSQIDKWHYFCLPLEWDKRLPRVVGV